MKPLGEIGDIWRFDSPKWNSSLPVAHYLITDINKSPYSKNQFYYVCIHLEYGTTVPDLLLDDSNVVNYNARKVA